MEVPWPATRMQPIDIMSHPTPNYSRNLASDNESGICPEAMARMEAGSHLSAPAYGDDTWTREACDRIREWLDAPEARIWMVFTGTAANSIALSTLARSWEAVICHEHAHIAENECGAPGFLGHGLTLLRAQGPNAKVTPQEVRRLHGMRRDMHAPRPAALSLTQPTEFGTLYTVEELRALGATARELGLAIHLDGARLSHAAACLPAPVGQWIREAGVDLLSLGMTKNGALCAEAIVALNPGLPELDRAIKQSGQLASKMRLQSAGFAGMLETGAWQRHALHANRMASRLARGLESLGHRIHFPVEANMVFVDLPAGTRQILAGAGWRFHCMLPPDGCRLVCSWSTQEAEVDAFIEAVQSADTPSQSATSP